MGLKKKKKASFVRVKFDLSNPKLKLIINSFKIKVKKTWNMMAAHLSHPGIVLKQFDGFNF